MGALWVQESYLEAVCSATGGFVDGAQTCCFALGDGLAYAVFYLEGDVVDTAASVVEEFLYGALWAGGLKELDLDFAYAEEGGLDFLVFDYFFFVILEAEDVGVVGEGFSD